MERAEVQSFVDSLSGLSREETELAVRNWLIDEHGYPTDMAKKVASDVESYIHDSIVEVEPLSPTEDV